MRNVGTVGIVGIALLLLLVLSTGLALADSNVIDQALWPADLDLDALLMGTAWEGALPWIYLPRAYAEDAALLGVTRGEDFILFVLERKDGAWYIQAANDALVTRGEISADTFCLYYEADGHFSIRQLFPDTGYIKSELYFHQAANGEWLLYMASYHDKQANAYLFDQSDDGYSLKRWLGAFAGLVKVYNPPDLSFSTVSLKDLGAFLTDTYAARNGPPDLPAASEADALNACHTFEAETPLPETVYCGPGERYLPSGEGIAGEAALTGWMQVFGQEDGWALVQYPAEEERNRFGYIPVEGVDIGAEIPALSWAPQALVATIGLTITDDPLRGHAAVTVIPAGTQVTQLGTLGDYWSYVDTTDAEGTPVRGFVLRGFLADPQAPAQPEAEVLLQVWMDRYEEELRKRLEEAHHWETVNNPGYSWNGIPQAYDIPMERAVGAALEKVLDTYGHTVEYLAKHYKPMAWFNVGDPYNPKWQINLSPKELNGGLEPYNCSIDAYTGDILSCTFGSNG